MVKPIDFDADKIATAITNFVLDSENKDRKHINTQKKVDDLATQTTVDFGKMSFEEKKAFLETNLNKAPVGVDNSTAPLFTPKVVSYNGPLR